MRVLLKNGGQIEVLHGGTEVAGIRDNLIGFLCFLRARIGGHLKSAETGIGVSRGPGIFVTREEVVREGMPSAVRSWMVKNGIGSGIAENLLRESKLNRLLTAMG